MLLVLIKLSCLTTVFQLVKLYNCPKMTSYRILTTCSCLTIAIPACNGDPDQKSRKLESLRISDAESLVAGSSSRSPPAPTTTWPCTTTTASPTTRTATTTGRRKITTTAATETSRVGTVSATSRSTRTTWNSRYVRHTWPDDALEMNTCFGRCGVHNGRTQSA